MSKRKKDRSQLSAPCPRAATLFGPHMPSTALLTRPSDIPDESPPSIASLLRRCTPPCRVCREDALIGQDSHSSVRPRGFDCSTAIFGSGQRSGPCHPPRSGRVGVLSGCFHPSVSFITAHHDTNSRQQAKYGCSCFARGRLMKKSATLSSCW